MTGKAGKRDVVRAEELVKEFDGIKAVDGVTFRLQAGECLGLLGPNGAGKTSTIRMIYGFSPLTGGHLSVFGLDVTSRWREIRYRIGVCQQENSLDPDLSVQDNLTVFARYFDIPRTAARQKAEKILAFMALEHRKNATVSQLSGGMQRRLTLGRALINDPELLILDEPTTGLDPQARHQVWEKLEELRGRGISILLTTHYIEEAANLCDRVIIMDHGKILVEGSPQELTGRHGQATLEDVFLRLTGRELRE